jgi:hypothetical protein
MATCVRCGRRTQTGARTCLACSIRPAPAGPSAIPTFVRPYVQLAGTPELLPVRASVAPPTQARRPAAPTRRQAATASLPASPPAVPALPAGRSAIPALPPGQADRPAPAIPPADPHGPGQPGAAEPRLVNPWLGRPPSGHWIALTAATAVVVIAAATATLIVEHHGSATQPPRPTPAAARHDSARGPATSTAATNARNASHARLVAIAPAVASAPHVHAIEAFLTRYFSAIDHHDYSRYRQLFSPSTRGGLSAASFAAGYGTTRDTTAVLRRISATGSGRVEAVVTFASYQRASDSPTRTSCTAWSISIYLIKSGSSYVIVSPPNGYQPSFRACS